MADGFAGRFTNPPSRARDHRRDSSARVRRSGEAGHLGTGTGLDGCYSGRGAILPSDMDYIPPQARGQPEHPHDVHPDAWRLPLCRQSLCPSRLGRLEFLGHLPPHGGYARHPTRTRHPL